MILGKLATPALKVVQTGAFTTESIPAEYMVVSTQRFIIGEDVTSFELRFGNVIIENEEERFDIVLRQILEMTSDELSTWGTDDSILLDIIATKLGAVITEKVNKNLIHTN